jgi:hypothetical protein
MMVLAALSLGSQLVLVADRVPTLNVEPSCRAAVASAVAAGRDMNSCLGDERTAREQIVKEWSRFTPAERSECSHLVTTGGPPSYVELLSCLEVSRDAREISHQPVNGTAANGAAATTTGQGGVHTGGAGPATRLLGPGTAATPSGAH